jgi:hypothetical protein
MRSSPVGGPQANGAHVCVTPPPRTPTHGAPPGRGLGVQTHAQLSPGLFSKSTPFWTRSALCGVLASRPGRSSTQPFSQLGCSLGACGVVGMSRPRRRRRAHTQSHSTPKSRPSRRTCGRWATAGVPSRPRSAPRRRRSSRWAGGWRDGRTDRQTDRWLGQGRHQGDGDRRGGRMDKRTDGQTDGQAGGCELAVGGGRATE